MKLDEITVTDENGNDFAALTPIPDNRSGPDDTNVTAFAFVTGENGFGVPNGVAVLTGLKKLPGGKYGA